MGVAQNSLNNVIATIAGGVVAGTHLYQQGKMLKTSEMQELAGLKESIPQEEAAVKNAETEAKVAELRKKAIDKGFNPEGLEVDVSTNSYMGPMRLNTVGLDYDKRKALEGLTTAQGVLAGKQAQLELKKTRFEELRKKYESKSDEAFKPKLDLKGAGFTELRREGGNK